MDKIEICPSEETARAMLAEKLQEARATTTYVGTIFTFYLGINALLYKVSFNENSFKPDSDIQVYKYLPLEQG